MKLKKNPLPTLYVQIILWCGAEIVCTDYPDLPGKLVRVLPDTVLVYCFLHAFGGFHRVVHFDILNDFWKLSGR